MDPTQTQSDDNNDVNSLEGADNPVDAQQQNTGGGSAGSNEPEKKKPSVIKRLWSRLNIYLLLFLLVLVIAVGITVVMVMRSRNVATNQGKITPQGLSSEALEQLANSDTTVGTPKQILNIASNAVFAGSVLMRSNLEVAGTMKIGGELTLSGITVSGNSKLGEVQADKLAVGGVTTIQGVLTVQNGMSVTGKSNFGDLSAAQLTTGSLQLNGDLKLTHHISAGGPIPSIERGGALGGAGTASLSGSDTAGSIAISTGNAPPAGCFATVTFNRAFNNTPHVLITPIGSTAASLDFYVNRSTSGFSICATNAAAAGQTFGFDYLALD